MRTSKLYAVLAISAVGLACAGIDDFTDPIDTWEAVLSGADVVPANASLAEGDADFTLSGTTLSFTVNITTAPATAITRIDLRAAAAGAAITATTGTIPLCGSGTLAACSATSSTGTATVTEAQINSLRGFGYNVTVRTTANNLDAGEIRGQVRIVPN